MTRPSLSFDPIERRFASSANGRAQTHGLRIQEEESDADDSRGLPCTDYFHRDWAPEGEHGAGPRRGAEDETGG